MKKFLMAIALCLVCAASCYSEELGKYSMSYFKGMAFDVSTTDPKPNGDFTFLIQVAGEHKHDHVYFAVERKNIQEFKTTLEKIRDKFIEWEKTAKENNVTDISKNFPYSLTKVDIAWIGREWWFSFGNRITPKFMVFKDGSCAMVFVDEVKSSTNEYITQQVYWVFQTKSDFDSLIQYLDTSVVDRMNEDKSQKMDLFE